MGHLSVDEILRLSVHVWKELQPLVIHHTHAGLFRHNGSLVLHNHFVLCFGLLWHFRLQENLWKGDDCGRLSKVNAIAHLLRIWCHQNSFDVNIFWTFVPVYERKLCHQNDCIRNQLTEHVPPLWRQEKGNELTRLNVEPNNHHIAFNSCKVYNSPKSCKVWRNIFAVSTSHLQLNSTWNARMSHRIMAKRRQGVMQKKYQSSLTTQAHPCTLVEEVAGLVFLSINREKVQ